jgi:hypothetical protein
MKNWKADKAEETSAESKNSNKSTGFENVKTIIADKIQNFTTQVRRWFFDGQQSGKQGHFNTTRLLQ